MACQRQAEGHIKERMCIDTCTDSRGEMGIVTRRYTQKKKKLNGQELPHGDVTVKEVDMKEESFPGPFGGGREGGSGWGGGGK